MSVQNIPTKSFNLASYLLHSTLNFKNGTNSAVDRQFFQPISLIGSTHDETSKFANPRVDWKETQEAHVFKADLPGLKKEEVKVEVEEGRVLQISGEIRDADKEDQKKENETWRRVERPRGKFCRRFWLPENAKIDEVKACMENGVLTVTFPKQEIKKPEVKTIEITG